VAGPWFAVHRVGEGWKTLEKVWMSNGTKSNIALVQTRLRFADQKDLYGDDGSSLKGFNFAQEMEKLMAERRRQGESPSKVSQEANGKQETTQSPSTTVHPTNPQASHVQSTNQPAKP
jgi:hypothetical protein